MKEMPPASFTKGITTAFLEKFESCSLDMLLDEMVLCTTLYNLGDLDELQASRRVIAATLLERLAELGIACKVHCQGCTIWDHGLCRCPWSVPSREEGTS